jgi:hypothetical protein
VLHETLLLLLAVFGRSTVTGCGITHENPSFQGREDVAA